MVRFDQTDRPADQYELASDRSKSSVSSVISADLPQHADSDEVNRVVKDLVKSLGKPG